MRDVVLDDEGGSADVPVTPTGRGRPGARGSERPDVGARDPDGRFVTTPEGRGRAVLGPGRPRWRRRRWAASAVVVLATAAGIVQGAVDGGPTAPLRGVPGALAPLDGPVRELWRADAARVDGLTRAGGLLVAAVHQRDGTAELVGRHPVTGVVRWATPLVDGGPARGSAACTFPSPGAAGARAAACVVVDRVGPVEGFSRFYVTEPRSARLVLLDAADGRVLQDTPVEPSTSVAAIGADLLTAWIGEDGHLRARRSDPWGTTERWTFRDPGALPLSGYGRRTWVSTAGGLVLAGGDAGWVLRADGSPVQPWYPQPAGAGWVDVLGDDLLVEPSPDGSRAAEVVDLAAARSFPVDGQPVDATLDDGSAPGLVAVHAGGDDLVAYTAPSGERRWTAAGAGTGATGYLVLAGRVLRTATDALVALDAATGGTVWSTPLAPAYGMSLATDGHVVLCVSRDAARGLVLGAYGVDDGRLRWDVDVPDDLDEIVVADGSLFAGTAGELIAYG